MPGPFDPYDTFSNQPQAVPLWLAGEVGNGSFPVQYEGVTVASLIPQHLWAAPRLDTNGQRSSLFEAFFFIPFVSTTPARGSRLASTWVTLESLYKDHRWASRDYALRVIMGDWARGASSTFGMIVERVRIPALNGWGGWPLLSEWVTVESLIREHRFGNDDGRLQEIMEDWFFGKTAGSPDMHILLTRRNYR